MKAEELRKLIEERIIPELTSIKEQTDCPRSENRLEWLIDNIKGAMD